MVESGQIILHGLKRVRSAVVRRRGGWWTAIARLTGAATLAVVGPLPGLGSFSAAGGGTLYAPPAAAPGGLGVSGGRLVLDGMSYRVLGVNAYEIGTEWGTDAGCGGMLSDAQLNAFFASLPPRSLVRFWAFEGSMAVNVITHQIDWGPLDRIFAAAAAHHQLLVPSLTGQSGGCDNQHWQDPSWYEGGFTQVFDDPTAPDGATMAPLSYWQYMQAIVTRYRSSPALGMWEPISEPEASTCPAQYQPDGCSGHQTCPDETAAAAALRHFFDVVGGEIHRLDPRHLVESGTLGSGQCGTQGSDYAYVSASPGIDVLSYHDYYASTETIGGDQWNGIGVRIDEAAELGKPIIGGEMGYAPVTGVPSCPDPTERGSELDTKVRAQVDAGSSGVLLWDWVPVRAAACNDDIVPGDHLLQTVGAVDCTIGPMVQPDDPCRLRGSNADA
ncbi:MAG: beta-mannosidase [Acidimicrobiales bacterium]